MVEQQPAEDRIPCPFCAEPIVRGAIKCRFCKERIEEQESAVAEFPLGRKSLAERVDQITKSETVKADYKMPVAPVASSPGSPAHNSWLVRVGALLAILAGPAVAILLLIQVPSDSTEGLKAFITVVAIFVLAVAAYFFPTFLAISSKKVNMGAIFALNFFLGWTLLGWVVALVWAVMHESSNE